MNTHVTHSPAHRILALGLMTLVLSACGPVPAAAPSAMQSPAGVIEGRAAPAATAAVPGAMSGQSEAAPKPDVLADKNSTGAAQSQATQPSEPAQERLIIRTADLTIVVKNTLEQINDISALASRYGGLVVSSNTSRVGQDLQGQIVVRVDPKSFNTALADIHKLAVEVRSENVHGDDVTAEYVDLGSHVKNLEVAEAQLQKIMEQATKTEDVLKVYQQLVQTRDDINQAKGRMQYLSRSAALSTITITLIPDALAKPIEVGGWRLDGVVKNAVEALISLMQALATIAINLIIVVLPTLLVIALPFFGLFWVIRRISRRGKTVKAA